MDNLAGGPHRIVETMATPRHRRGRRASALWFGGVLLLASCNAPPWAQTHNAADLLGPGTLNVADAAIAGGDPDMALSVTQSILGAHPDNADVLIHEGNAYYALQRCPAAAAAYRLALHYDPRGSQAETGLGRCLLKTDPRAAEAAFLRAIADDPGNAAALNDLGIARDLQGNFAGAVDAYARALQADPQMTAAEVNLGFSLALSGNGPAALRYLGPLAMGLGTTPKIRQDYAAALLAAGRPAEAKQVLAVDLPPDQALNAVQEMSQAIAARTAPPAPAVAAAPAPLAEVTAVTTGPPAARPVLSVPPAVPPPVVTKTADATPPARAPPRRRPPATREFGAMVQLGALNSAAAAARDWRSVSACAPALFNGRTPSISIISVRKHIFYRLRVAGFGSDAAAAKFCGAVSAAGKPCILANF